MKAMVFHEMDTEEVSDRFVAPCFVNGREAYDGEINLGVEENMILNEYAVKLCLKHEVKRGNKVLKKELIVALRGEIYFVNGGQLTQEEATKEALAIRISQKFTLIEEVRPVIETMAYHDKYKKILDEIWKDKVELDEKIVNEEEEAVKRIKGEALKEKDDPRAFIFPIILKGKVNENTLADTGVPLQGAYNPPGYAQPQYDQYYQQYPPSLSHFLELRSEQLQISHPSLWLCMCSFVAFSGALNHQALIQDLETKFGQLSDQCSSRATGSLPCNTQTNPKPSPTNDTPYRPPSTRNKHVNAVFTRSGLTYDSPVNLNAKTTVIHDDSEDEVEEAEKELESSSSKPKDNPFCTSLMLSSESKTKKLNLGVGDDRITFLMDKAMRHSHSNYDTCFRMDVIDEVTEEELDALLDESKPFCTTSKKISESSLDHEFEDFMSIKIEEIPEQEEEAKDNFEELPLEENLRIKNSIQDPPTNLVMKPLPKHSEYAFLEKRVSSSKVVKKKIIKLLDVGIIYPIEDSPWVSPVHCVPKKGGMTVVTNEENELVPTRTVTGWRVCIDYQGIMLGYKVSSTGLEVDKAKSNIKNKKGAENVAADHLSRLENLNLEELRDDDIDDNFPDETLINVSSIEEDKIPWFADFANYLVGKILRKGLTYAQRCKFFSKLKHYFWDEPYLFKMSPDGMIRRSVYGAETQKILDECHHGPTRGHYGPSTTTKKVFDAGFY
nr:reverse transcriptase domain-containing protein [Tanacetum cinerariifolium]